MNSKGLDFEGEFGMEVYEYINIYYNYYKKIYRIFDTSEEINI